MKTNNQQLAELIAKHRTNRSVIAAMLDVDPSTVDRWLVPEKCPTDKRRKNPTYRAMPGSALTLIKILFNEITTNKAMQDGWDRYSQMTGDEIIS